MHNIEEDLSPQAKIWVEHLSKKEGRKPGRIISQIIEFCMELESAHGEGTVEALVERLTHGPTEMIQGLETEKAAMHDFIERAENLLQIIRLYCVQLHTRKNLGKRGEPIYTVKEKEKKMFFDEAPNLTELGEEDGIQPDEEEEFR